MAAALITPFRARIVSAARCFGPFPRARWTGTYLVFLAGNGVAVNNGDLLRISFAGGAFEAPVIEAPFMVLPRGFDAVAVISVESVAAAVATGGNAPVDDIEAICEVIPSP